MAKSLLIVESPAKAKTIQKYLGKDYDVVASKGHIKDLPKRGGVDIENGFQETYELLEEKGKGEVIKTIKKKAKQVQKVLLATDPDREGEAIAYHLAEEVKKANKDVEVQRVLFNEITKKGVHEGLDHPRELDQHLYEAQRTRRVLDRIGGYPLSSLLWRKLAFGLSAGRVQTPALRIIVDRQSEIDAFVPEHYWLVESGSLGPKRAGASSRRSSRSTARSYRRSARVRPRRRKKTPRTVRRGSQEGELPRRQDHAARAASEGAFTVHDVEAPAGRVEPARHAAEASDERRAVVLRGRRDRARQGSARRSVSSRTCGRTPCASRPTRSARARAFIEKTYGKAALPDDAQRLQDRRSRTSRMHTRRSVRRSMDLPPEKVNKYLKEPQLKLYKLIWDRFVASQMVPAVYDQTSVEIEAAHAGGARRTGSARAAACSRIRAGARCTARAWPRSPARSRRTPTSDRRLRTRRADSSRAERGREAHAREFRPAWCRTHKQTEPPPYFNEAALVKKLEEEGIGRPSTYAEIISKVQARDYVTRTGQAQADRARTGS